MNEALAEPGLPYVVGFVEGVEIAEQGAVTELRARGRSASLGRLPRGVSAALGALAGGGAIEREMVALVVHHDGAAGTPRLHYFLERLAQLGLLHYSARRAGHALATLLPTRPGSFPIPVLPAAGVRYTLSRFACIRRDADLLVVESPLACARVVLHDAAATAFCHALLHPRTAVELARAVPELSGDMAALILGLLLSCRAATPEGPEGEAGARALAPWSFHDLLFHARSRLGRSAGPFGATYPLLGERDPLPAVKPRMGGNVISLHRPDMDALQASSAPFTRVLEERRSRRTYGAQPIRAEQLGELLFRAARVRAVVPVGERRYAISDRPYPGAGACYELELYLAVGACAGLAPGLYHYEPDAHALAALSDRTKAVDALLAGARGLMSAPAAPQVLVVLTARFERVMWKYEGMAYAAILKDVGALYQTLSLVATAMGLSACALGGGDADGFATAAGLDYYAETSVGELALGSRAEN